MAALPVNHNRGIVAAGNLRSSCLLRRRFALSISPGGRHHRCVSHLQTGMVEQLLDSGKHAPIAMNPRMEAV